MWWFGGAWSSKMNIKTTNAKQINEKITNVNQIESKRKTTPECHNNETEGICNCGISYKWKLELDIEFSCQRGLKTSPYMLPGAVTWRWGLKGVVYVTRSDFITSFKKNWWNMKQKWITDNFIVKEMQVQTFCPGGVVALSVVCCTLTIATRISCKFCTCVGMIRKWF